MPKGKKRLTRSLGGNIAVGMILVLLGAFMVLPLLYTVVSAFKPFHEIFVFPPRFFVRNPTLDNFTNLIELTSNMWVPLIRYIFNSVFISAAATLIHILFASAAAYPLAKHTFPGKEKIFTVMVAMLMFSGAVTALPQYIILSGLQLIDSYMAIIFPAIGSTLGVFLMRQFMVQMIPDSVIEAARIDGASEYRTFFSIIMPNVKPAWLTLMVFTFQATWANNGVTFIYSEELKTLPTALGQIATAGIARMGEGMAASLLLILPPIALFIFSQTKVVETMAFAGVKE